MFHIANADPTDARHRSLAKRRRPSSRTAAIATYSSDSRLQSHSSVVILRAAASGVAVQAQPPDSADRHRRPRRVGAPAGLQQPERHNCRGNEMCATQMWTTSCHAPRNAAANMPFHVRKQVIAPNQPAHATGARLARLFRGGSVVAGTHPSWLPPSGCRTAGWRPLKGLSFSWPLFRWTAVFRGSHKISSSRRFRL